MTAENNLTLAFVGNGEVHAANSRALIKDLISAHKKKAPNAKITFIFPIDDFTSTMDDLVDFGLTSGYDLELCGRPDDFKNFATLKQQATKIYELKAPVRLLLQRILPQREDARLILIADPNEDDDAYNAVGWASESNIPVRSLLKGLDTVVFSDGDEEEQEESVARDDDWDEEEADEAGLHVVDDEEEYDEETEEEEAEEEEAEEEEETEEDEDVEAEGDDEFEDEEEEESDEDEESEEDEEEEEAEDEEEFEAEDDEEIEADEEDLDDDVETEEEDVAPKKYTESQLTRLSDRDYEEFLEIAAKYRVKPGRGIRKANMVKQILEAQGGKKTAATSRRPAAKKTTAARTTSKRAPAKKRTAAKAPAAKKARTATTARRGTARKSAAPTTTKTRPAAASAAASTNGQVPKAALRQFIKLAQSTLELAEQLL